MTPCLPGHPHDHWGTSFLPLPEGDSGSLTSSRAIQHQILQTLWSTLACSTKRSKSPRAPFCPSPDQCPTRDPSPPAPSPRLWHIPPQGNWGEEQAGRGGIFKEPAGPRRGDQVRAGVGVNGIVITQCGKR